MQGAGWAAAVAPTLGKIYGDDKEGLGKALSHHTSFINTHPTLAPFLMGILMAMEEAHEPRELIDGLKNSMFAPIAGIGDALFWFTVLPQVSLHLLLSKAAYWDQYCISSYSPHSSAAVFRWQESAIA